MIPPPKAAQPPFVPALKPAHAPAPKPAQVHAAPKPAHVAPKPALKPAPAPQAMVPQPNPLPMGEIEVRLKHDPNAAKYERREKTSAKTVVELMAELNMTRETNRADGDCVLLVTWRMLLIHDPALAATKDAKQDSARFLRDMVVAFVQTPRGRELYDLYHAAVVGDFDAYLERLRKDGHYFDDFEQRILKLAIPTLPEMVKISLNSGAAVLHHHGTSDDSVLEELLRKGITRDSLAALPKEYEIVLYTAEGYGAAVHWEYASVPRVPRQDAEGGAGAAGAGGARSSSSMLEGEEEGEEEYANMDGDEDKGADDEEGDGEEGDEEGEGEEDNEESEG